MRIVGGALGGRRLKAPAGAQTRPTSDRVREALFSILGAPVGGARVLDVFGGAGTLGLESLSRGATEAVFIDNARAAVRCIRDNASNLGVEDATRVHQGDALRVLPRLTGQFDWVFVDPPYRSDLAGRVLDWLGSSELVATGGCVVVEHDRRDAPAGGYGCLQRTDHRRYGDTELSFYRRSPP